jgi:hypothetical protein
VNKEVLKEGIRLGRLLMAGLILCFSLSSVLQAANEQEQLQLENQIQQRIEDILAKTLPPESYLVTVRVEMESRPRTNTVRTVAPRRNGVNPFLTPGNFMLPGVPQKKEFVETQEGGSSETTVDAFSAETKVRRILITILVAPDISADKIRAIRDFVSASVPFNPLRGDEMDIQNSSLLKRTAPGASPTGIPPSSDRSLSSRASTSVGSLADRAGVPMLLFLGALILLLIIFVGFLFGPVRAFLNRLLAVLPRVGEQAAYAVSNASPKNNPVTGGPSGVGSNGHSRSGASRSSDQPFHFIREEQLNKLPILFRQMGAPEAALVLAYLPPEWASRVLGGLDQIDQSTVMAELSQAREVPPEIVKEIEEQVKGKLPYLVGGAEWIQSVYQYTQPQTQRALLGTLSEQDPELAKSLRRRTFFFEDLAVVSTPSLRLISQELGYPTLASALKDEKPDFREAVLKRLPPAVREIIQQELDLSTEDRAASAQAKTTLVTLARRLLQEGRISLPERR